MIQPGDLDDTEEEKLSEYEKARRKTMEENDAVITLLDKVKIGKMVLIPHAVFPEEPEPEGGFWIGHTVRTNLGGLGDVGISIAGEAIFTRPRLEVAHWVVED